MQKHVPRWCEESLDQNKPTTHLTLPFFIIQAIASIVYFSPCLKFAASLGPASRAAAPFIAVVWRRKKAALVATSQKCSAAISFQPSPTTEPGAGSGKIRW